MAYATGSATTLTDLLSAIRTFAIAQGWTIDKWTPASNLLFLSDDLTKVAFQAAVEPLTSFETGAAVVINQTVLYGALATGINAGLNTFWGHPGSIVTAANDVDAVRINDLSGPFPSYHLFADPALGRHIHVVVQTASDRWQCFGFGRVDKGGLTHAGSSYLTGGSRSWVRAAGAVDAALQYYNLASGFTTGFAVNAGRTGINNAVLNLYSPDALPDDSAEWPKMIASASIMPHLTGRSRPDEWPGERNAHLLSGVVRHPVSQFSGAAMFHALPVVQMAAGASKLCWVGDFPNVRLVNMDGMRPGQLVEIAADDWLVFPVGRQVPWGTQVQTGFQFSTGQYALAFKRVP
jgi:hypothetical protein